MTTELSNDRRILSVDDKMRLLQWLYPDVYAKLQEREED
jgi:hypothetical protein